MSSVDIQVVDRATRPLRRCYVGAGLNVEDVREPSRSDILSTFSQRHRCEVAHHIFKFPHVNTRDTAVPLLHKSRHRYRGAALPRAKFHTHDRSMQIEEVKDLLSVPKPMTVMRLAHWEIFHFSPHVAPLSDRRCRPSDTVNRDDSVPFVPVGHARRPTLLHSTHRCAQTIRRHQAHLCSKECLETARTAVHESHHGSLVHDTSTSLAALRAPHQSRACRDKR